MTAHGPVHQDVWCAKGSIVQSDSSFFVMEPVFTTAWEQGLSPYMDLLIEEQEAWALTTEPFRAFMMARTDPEALATL
ncbi:MAG: hypothetical protein AAF225_09285, partial [Pseudomonadota bacterium]